MTTEATEETQALVKKDPVKTLVGAVKKVGGIVEEYPLWVAGLVGVAAFYAGRRSTRVVADATVSKAGTKLARAAKAGRAAAEKAWRDESEPEGA